MKLNIQKRGHRLHKFLSWLLILGTVFSVFAGSSLSVFAADSVGSSGDIVKEDGYIYEFVMMTNSEDNSYNRWTGLSFPADSNPFIFYNSSLKAYCIRGFDFSNNKVVNVSFTTVSPYYKGGNTFFPEKDKFYAPSMCGSVYFYHNAYDYTCSFSGDLYIFSSLADAEAYYINNNTAGILQEPGWDDSGQVDEAWFQELIDKIKDWTGGMFEILVAPLELLAKGIDHGVQLILDLLPDKIANALRSIYEAQKELAGNTLGKIVDLHDFLVGKSTEFLTFLKDIYDTLEFISVVAFSNLPQGIKDALEPFLSGYGTLLEKVSDRIYHLGDKFSDWFPTINEIRDLVKNSRLKDIADDLKKMVSLFSGDFSFSDFVSTFWENYKEYSNPFDFFAAWSKETFKHTIFYTLFVPSDEFLDEIGEDIHERFSGIFSIIDYVKKVIDFLMTCSGEKAPSFTVNLGKSASYYLGDSTVTIDFSWYEPYKPTVDLLFTAIIWAGFLWRMYSRIPEILNGVGMAVSLPFRVEYYEVKNERMQTARERSDIRWNSWVSGRNRRGR